MNHAESRTFANDVDRTSQRCLFQPYVVISVLYIAIVCPINTFLILCAYRQIYRRDLMEIYLRILMHQLRTYVCGKAPMCLRNLPLLHSQGLLQLSIDGASGLHHSFFLAAYSEANRWLFRAGSGYMIRAGKLSIHREISGCQPQPRTDSAKLILLLQS